MEVWCDWWERYEGLNGGVYRLGFILKFLLLLLLDFLVSGGSFFGASELFSFSFVFCVFCFFFFFFYLIPFAGPGQL